MKTLKLFLAIAVIGFFTASCGNEKKDDSAENAEMENSEMTDDANGEMGAEGEEVTNEFLQNPTTVTFEEMEYDFGTVEQGATVEHKFVFTNTGEHPLLISNAQGSCGCTVPSYPQEPIPPGEKAEILVKFDSKGKSGDQHKTVTVTANTDPAQTRLAIKGKVNAPDAPAGDAGQ